MAGAGYAGPLIASGGGASLPLGFSGNPFKRSEYLQSTLSAAPVIIPSQTLATNGVGAGTIVSANIVTPLNTTAVSSNKAYLLEAAAPIFTSVDVGPVASFLVLPHTLATCRIYVGLGSSQSVLDSNTPGGSGFDFMGFRFSTSSGDASWIAMTASSGSSNQTVTASGVAPVVDTPVQLIIDASAITSVKFYVNGTLKATHSTNLPSGIGLGILVGIETLAASIANLYFARAYVESQ